MKTSSKLSLLVGLAAGYVLGTRAGRERYEQIAEASQSLWNSEPVQQQVSNVQGLTGKYVPKAVESSFRGLGKVASGVVTRVLRTNGDKSSRKSSANSAEAPTGTVTNPAQS